MSAPKLEYRMNNFLVCLVSSLIYLRLLKFARTVHQQHVLVSLLPRRMIYFTALRPPSTNPPFAPPQEPRDCPALALNTDIVILSASGNVYDALSLTVTSTSWDTKVMRTRRDQCQPKSNMLGIQDVKMLSGRPGSPLTQGR